MTIFLGDGSIQSIYPKFTNHYYTPIVNEELLSLDENIQSVFLFLKET